MDPYNTYFDVEIEARSQDLGDAILQLDGEATSLISELTLTQDA